MARDWDRTPLVSIRIAGQSQRQQCRHLQEQSTSSAPDASRNALQHAISFSKSVHTRFIRSMSRTHRYYTLMCAASVPMLCGLIWVSTLVDASYCWGYRCLTGDVYPVTDLAALPTSSALMFDLHVDFRCTFGLPSLELFARGTRPGHPRPSPRRIGTGRKGPQAGVGICSGYV